MPRFPLRRLPVSRIESGNGTYGGGTQRPEGPSGRDTGYQPLLAAAITRLKAFETRESEAKALADGLLHHPRIGWRPLEGLAGRVETAIAQRRQEHHALDPDGTFQDRRSRAADTVGRANEAIEVAETTVRLPRTDLAAAEAALAEAEQVFAKAREDLEVAERTLVH